MTSWAPKTTVEDQDAGGVNIGRVVLAGVVLPAVVTWVLWRWHHRRQVSYNASSTLRRAPTTNNSPRLKVALLCPEDACLRSRGTRRGRWGSTCWSRPPNMRGQGRFCAFSSTLWMITGLPSSRSSSVPEALTRSTRETSRRSCLLNLVVRFSQLSFTTAWHGGLRIYAMFSGHSH